MSRQHASKHPPRRTYLTDSKAIPISPPVAVVFGINAAAFLQQLHFLLSSAEEADKQYNFVDGHWWVYYSYPKWIKHLPWLKPKTIQRIAGELSGKGIVYTRSNPHNTWDRSLWYRLDYDAFYKQLDEAAASGQIVQMDEDKRSRSKRTKSPDLYITNQNNEEKIAAAKADGAVLEELTPEQLFDLATSKDKADKPKRQRRPYFDLIVELFGVDYAALTDSERSGIGKVETQLKKAGRSLDDVRTIFKYCQKKFTDFTWHALTTHASMALKGKAKPSAPVHIDAAPEPVITDADRAESLRIMQEARANRPDFGGKAAS